jgi:hypothetical protein
LTADWQSLPENEKQRHAGAAFLQVRLAARQLMCVQHGDDSGGNSGLEKHIL